MMSVLGLWILVSLLGYSIGYVIVQRPAEYYNYQTQPYARQWQPLQYQFLDYQPSYYNNYYYPSAFTYAVPNKPYPKPLKPDLGHGLSYEEGQNLLQVYRLIRVITIFRTPTKKLTLLDKLLKRLTKQSLQDQLVDLVCHVDGYEEVAELDQGPPGIKLDLFVDDPGRLLFAIQRALNALDLDEYEYDHHYGKHHGFCGVHKELCGELRELRDEANALSVPLIKKHRVYEIKAMVKQALDSDILEDLDEDLESRLLELDDIDIEMPEIPLFEEVPMATSYDAQIPEDYQEQINEDYQEQIPVIYQEPIYRSYQEQLPVAEQYDEQKLNQLATVLHNYFQQQSTTESHQEIHQKEVVPTSTPTYPRTTVPTTATVSVIPIAKEDTNTWFGSLFGNGDALPGTVDVSEPAVLIEPVTVEKSDPKKVVENNVSANTEKSNSASAFFSAPLWLSKTSDQQEVENKEASDNATKAEKEEARDLPDELSRIDVDDNGPTRVDMFKLKEASPALDFIDADPSRTSVESRNQQSPKNNARRAVKEEILKVLSLLEEAFEELHGRISDPDVDKLVDGLRDVEAGVRWTEMLSALQKLITEKQLESGEQILDVLEHWKEDENGQINNGYFERTYGGQTTKASVNQ
ncbi:uncharacterized protein LOC110679351 isoform X2 [Aedes aegypti]|uniref:Uncharacterized protein n=1 Tax=Aedes aegypti TaxID=7159 RepID=A0A6I8U4H6_AEDAE|nr:uncharacterized protein LOC110679351 isoform X2 [Aedes aegypti]